MACVLWVGIAYVSHGYAPSTYNLDLQRLIAGFLKRYKCSLKFTTSGAYLKKITTGA